MKRFQTLTTTLSIIILALFFVSGCATNLTKPSVAPTPTKVKLSNFTNFEMKTVGISEKFGGSSANQRAQKKIEEHLFNNMQMVFTNLKRIDEGGDFSTSSKRTLQITPFIKEIKFISGGARFMVGAMAGSSAVLMQVTLTDSSNGEVIANPEFYRDASAFSGGFYGSADNRMLERIAKDIVQYCQMNK